MTIDIITIFPEMFANVFSSSIVKIAQEKKKLQIRVWNLRDFTEDKHRKVDSPPYGGGPGMVMKCGPLFRAVESLVGQERKKEDKVVFLSPQGRPLKQDMAPGFLKTKRLVLVCGRYEGFDERTREELADEEISIGDYVLSGGEIPAMVMVEFLARLIPGVVGKEESINNESFENGLLDFPHYTRPEVFRGKKVPSVLISGNHKQIAAWRRKMAEQRTKKRRPNLWD